MPDPVTRTADRHCRGHGRATATAPRALLVASASFRPGEPCSACAPSVGRA